MNARQCNSAADSGVSGGGARLQFGCQESAGIGYSDAKHMASPDQVSSVITLAEAARELRCSKAHISNVVNGKVPHLPPLPVVRIGRRVLIRYEALLEWIRLAEQASGGCYDSARSGFIA